MRPLSALDAISPAWNHTSSLLLAPRSWRLLLKIGFVAVLASLGTGGGNFNIPSSTHHMHPAGPLSLPLILTGILAVSIVVTIGLAISLALFYIGSRLQFVLFDVLLTRNTTIGPIWKRFGGVTWRWMGLKLLCLLALLLCLAPLIIPAAIHFLHIFASGSTTHPDSLTILSGVFGFIAPIFFVVLAASILFTLLFDFGLPSIALENTSITVTAERVFALLRAEPGQCLLYLLMRFLLGLACIVGAEIALAIAALITALPFGAIAAVLWATLHNGASGGKALMITGWVLLGLVFLALVICAAIIVIGYVHCFLRSYAIYFLAGRYPLLSQILEQNLPPSPSSALYPTPYPPYTPTPAPGQ
jgi:hypothetical protein